VSTRLIGGLVMTHSDDDGMVIPPRLAPAHVVILPFRGDDSKGPVMECIERLARELRDTSAMGRPLEIEIDARDLRGGDKQWEWIKKGIPLRIEVGPRDVEGKTVVVGRRDQGPRDKLVLTHDELPRRVPELLAQMQENLLSRARAFRDENTRAVSSLAELDELFGAKGADDKGAPGGFALVHWDGTPESEAKLKDWKATIRCLPEPVRGGASWEGALDEPGACIVSGRPSARRVLVAKSY
jgi:prolyl-tRNA synthetase